MKAKFIIPCAAALLLASCSCSPSQTPSSSSKEEGTSQTDSSERQESLPSSEGSSSKEDASSEGSSEAHSDDSSEGASSAEFVEVESISIAEEGDLDLYPGQEKDLDVNFNPENATDKTLTWESSDPEIVEVVDGHIKALKEGDVTITATAHNDKTATIGVHVDNALNPDNIIDTLYAPKLIADREAVRKKLDDVSQIQTNPDPDRSAYYKNEEGTIDMHKVGVDNRFKFAVTGAYTDEDLEEHTLPSPFLKLSVKMAEEAPDFEDLDPLSDDEAREYLVYNEGNIVLTRKAVGKKFQVTFDADESKYYAVDPSLKPVVFEFEAVDGYNVYEAEELALYDNTPAETNEWETFKAEHGLDNIAEPKSIVLQANLTITKDDLPTSFFYTEEEIDGWLANNQSVFASYLLKKNSFREAAGLEPFTEETGRDFLVGSMKDYVTIYERKSNPDIDFALEGNYFSIDASSLKQVAFYNAAFAPEEDDRKLDEYDEEDGSHSQLFGFNSVNSRVDEFGGKTTFRDVTITGNGDYSADDTYAGGLIAFKIGKIEAHFENIVTSKTFISFFPRLNGDEQDDSQYAVTYIDRCKNFDSYNSLVYVFGTKNNYITNSFMKRAGGGIFLLDDVNASDKSASKHGSCEVYSENVYYENWVTGKEPWFIQKQATALTSNLAGIGGSYGWLGKNAASSGDHKTIVKKNAKDEDCINLIAIAVDGRDALNNTIANGQPLQTVFEIDNGIGHAHALDMNLPEGSLDAALSGADATAEVALPVYKALYSATDQPGMIFASSKGGHGALVNANGTNGATFTGARKAVLCAYEADDEWKAMADGINQAMGIPLATKEYDIYQVDQRLGTDFAGDLASGEYISAYIKAVAGTNFLGVFLGTETIA